MLGRGRAAHADPPREFSAQNLSARSTCEGCRSGQKEVTLFQQPEPGTEWVVCEKKACRRARDGSRSGRRPQRACWQQSERDRKSAPLLRPPGGLPSRHLRRSEERRVGKEG